MVERLPEFQSEIDEFGWNVDAPPQRESDSAKIYLVRHGMSMFNYRAFKAEKQYTKQSPEFTAIENDIGVIDPELHPIGVAQSEVNAPRLHAMNVKYVIVSPMQRAMQTAIHMFKGHPNLANIQFIVEPITHEILHTMCDMHMDAVQMMMKYAPGQPACHGVNFDFSKIAGTA